MWMWQLGGRGCQPYLPNLRTWGMVTRITTVLEGQREKSFLEGKVKVNKYLEEASYNETEDAEKIIVMCQEETIERAQRARVCAGVELMGEEKMNNEDGN